MVLADEVTIREVDERLRDAYGDKKWRRRLPPLDSLIATVISQHTSDVNRDKAFRELKRRFPSWERMMKAPTKTIAAAIRSAGLANQKAPRIKAILSAIAEQNKGRLSLDFLKDLPVPEALALLKSLPGVGPKTAACVLLFSFGKPVFPVDTHIYRIARRLGWLTEGVPEAKANEILDAVIPDDIKYRLHLNLITHGRQVCRPHNPRCPECVLNALCAYYRKNFQGKNFGRGARI